MEITFCAPRTCAYKYLTGFFTAVYFYKMQNFFLFATVHSANLEQVTGVSCK